MKRAIVALALLAGVLAAFGQDGPQSGSHLGAQAAADALRARTGADAAFLPGDLINASYQKSDLSSLIQPPNGTDDVVVISLTGEQIKQALERSVALYPQRNPGFLQLSGIEATFSKGATPGQRVVSVTIRSGRLDEKGVYQVAMPASLARGGLGYFKIWDTSKTPKTFGDATLESVLKGKPFTDSSPRWSVVG